jgi:hypothetical protein
MRCVELNLSIPAAHGLWRVNGLNQCSTVDASTLSYDLNGNLTSDGSTTLA